MPVHVLQDLANLVPQVPPHLQRISIPLLSNTVDCSDKSVKGVVCYKGPLASIGEDDYVLKVVLQDRQQNPAADHTAINVILFGELAKTFSETANQGDVILVTGFTVGLSPTFTKDCLHPWNLQLAGDDAFIYVYPSVEGPRTSTPKRATSAPNVKVATPKYSYVPLKDLKPGEVVNVYAVVTFFKQPFQTKGTDYCSTLMITDQSNVKVCCTIFSSKLEEHPQIFKVGDIIRLHRVKPQLFNNSICLLTSLGFSAVTFDGAAGAATVPRASGRTFHFGEEDRRAVEALRSWAASRPLLPADHSVPLSSVQPKIYFDLTCQLLAKATVDTNCTLLKVWDGTKCAHPLQSVSVDPDALEGDPTAAKDRLNLTANVLVFDDHVGVVQDVKPGAFLRIYNLHAVPQIPAGGLPSNSTDHPGQPDHLVFHLHRGTAFGRGVRVLPDDSPELQGLKRALESFSEPKVEPSDDTLVEEWCTPLQSLDGDSADESPTVRLCDHVMQQVTLAQVKNGPPDEEFHVCARLKSYQPGRLYQALKLHCGQCNSVWDVPDIETIRDALEDALLPDGTSSEEWAITGELDSTHLGRKMALHVVRELIVMGQGDKLIFLENANLEEIGRIASGYDNIVPVTAADGRMSLMDLSMPFLFRGTKHYYGCTRCSQVKPVEPVVEGVEEWDEKSIAAALGVTLLQYRLLLKLHLQDGRDHLEALLWRDAETFFGVSAEDAASNQETQDKVQQTMDVLCPPGSAKLPWINWCIRSYTVNENGQSRVCYQVCDTAIKETAPPSTE